MEKEEDRLCRLCLKTVSNEIIEQIGNVRESLEMLQLKLNFQIVEEQVLCRNCKGGIKKCLNFKLASLDVETLIVSLYNSGSNLKLDLKKVYLHQRKFVDTADIFRGQEVCRLCMELNSISSCTALTELGGEKCIPWLNFNLTTDNLICDSCLNSLKFYFQFVQNCIGTENEINKVCKFDTVVEDKRSMTEIKLDLDEFCCDIEENKIVKTEIIYENEKEKLDRQNMEDDIKMNVKVNIVKEERIGESTEQLLEKEPEYVDFGGLCCETEEINQLNTEIKIEKEDVEFYGDSEMDIITDVDEPVVKMEVKRFPLNLSQLQSEELKMVHEPNGMQTMQNDIESIQDNAVYKCENCLFITKLGISLKTHQLTHREHSEVKVYECESCAYVSRTKSNLKTHTVTHQQPSEVKVYKCESCLFKTKRKSTLKTHQLTHRELSEVEVYKCESCLFITKHESSFKRHQVIHREPSEVKVYKCESCLFITKHESSFKRHQVIHREPSEVKVYKCESCLFITKHESSFKRHQVIHQEPSEVKVYKCESCSYVTKRRDRLKSHTLTHQLLSKVPIDTPESCA